MLIKEYIIGAFQAIKSNKLRAGLSMLGIIIGVSSVIIMLAIGEGTQSDIVKRFEGMGANLITLRSGGGNQSNVRNISSQNSNLFDEETIFFLKTIDGVKNISPIVSSSRQIIYQNNNTQSSIIGVLPIYKDLKNLSISNGRFIETTDIENYNMVVVLGSEIAKTLFLGNNPIGQDIKAQNTILTVIGVLSDNSQANNSIFVPISSSQLKISGNHYYSSIDIQINDTKEMEFMLEYIKNSLIKYFNVSDLDNLPFSVNSLSEILSSIQEVTNIMKTFLAGIAAISLIVGGIGVMNIMLVSVTERTKEIGIRKAIGARKQDILRQFLIEALFLSLFAGTIGIIISVLAIEFIKKFTSAVITSNSIIIAFSSAVSIGIIFGILPASKASKLKPIDALRYE